MKKLFAIIMCVCVVMSLVACATTPSTGDISDDQRYENFISQFSTEYQDITAINARVELDAEGNKIIFADIKNSGFDEISNIVLAFAAWDADGNFITIKSKDKPDNTAAEFQFNLPNVSVPERSIWSADTGVYLDASCEEITYIKAMVVSCKNGENDYNNELYNAWKDTYLQKPLTDIMRTIDAEFDPKQQLIKLKNQMAAEKVYISKSAVSKNLDEKAVFLTANVKNDLEQAVTGFEIAFAAWNENGTPVYISTPSDDANLVAESNYVKTGKLSNIELLANEEWIGCENENGDVTGLQIDFAHSDITHVEAIVVSYTTADGQTHENALYNSWKEYYSGALLEDWMRTDI